MIFKTFPWKFSLHVNRDLPRQTAICKSQSTVHYFFFFFLQELPGDQPELSKCMMPLHLNYKSKLVGDGLELKRIGERLLI